LVQNLFNKNISEAARMIDEHHDQSFDWSEELRNQIDIDTGESDFIQPDSYLVDNQKDKDKILNTYLNPQSQYYYQTFIRSSLNQLKLLLLRIRN
jgi:hypothetical protein